MPARVDCVSLGRIASRFYPNDRRIGAYDQVDAGSEFCQGFAMGRIVHAF
jgi:hypothetical protein